MQTFKLGVDPLEVTLSKVNPSTHGQMDQSRIQRLQATEGENRGHPVGAHLKEDQRVEVNEVKNSGEQKRTCALTQLLSPIRLGKGNYFNGGRVEMNKQEELTLKRSLKLSKFEFKAYKEITRRVLNSNQVPVNHCTNWLMQQKEIDDIHIHAKLYLPVLAGRTSLINPHQIEDCKLKLQRLKFSNDLTQTQLGSCIKRKLYHFMKYIQWSEGLAFFDGLNIMFDQDLPSFSKASFQTFVTSTSLSPSIGNDIVSFQYDFIEKTFLRYLSFFFSRQEIKYKNKGDKCQCWQHRFENKMKNIEELNMMMQISRGILLGFYWTRVKIDKVRSGTVYISAKVLHETWPTLKIGDDPIDESDVYMVGSGYGHNFEGISFNKQFFRDFNFVFDDVDVDVYYDLPTRDKQEFWWRVLDDYRKGHQKTCLSQYMEFEASEKYPNVWLNILNKSKDEFRYKFWDTTYFETEQYIYALQECGDMFFTLQKDWFILLNSITNFKYEKILVMLAHNGILLGNEDLCTLINLYPPDAQISTSVIIQEASCDTSFFVHNQPLNKTFQNQCTPIYDLKEESSNIPSSYEHIRSQSPSQQSPVDRKLAQYSSESSVIPENVSNFSFSDNELRPIEEQQLCEEPNSHESSNFPISNSGLQKIISEDVSFSYIEEKQLAPDTNQGRITPDQQEKANEIVIPTYQEGMSPTYQEGILAVIPAYQEGNLAVIPEHQKGDQKQSESRRQMLAPDTNQGRAERFKQQALRPEISSFSLEFLSDSDHVMSEDASMTERANVNNIEALKIVEEINVQARNQQIAKTYSHTDVHLMKCLSLIAAAQEEGLPPEKARIGQEVIEWCSRINHRRLLGEIEFRKEMKDQPSEDQDPEDNLKTLIIKTGTSHFNCE